MCGIVGYTGPRDAGPILIEGLRRLEYRGYDSAGIALVDEQGDLAIQRAIRDAERRLGEGGRVLVRPSGTEPALRVMVEGPDAALVAEIADAIATLAGDRLH